MIFIALIIMQGCKQSPKSSDDIWSFVQARKSALSLGVYITAQTVQEQFSTEAGCREAISVLHCNGISKVYVEVYRCEPPVQPDLLKKTVDLLKKNGFEVVGGIATLPGDGFSKKFINGWWTTNEIGGTTTLSEWRIRS